jgi:hypothetical protein
MGVLKPFDEKRPGDDALLACTADDPGAVAYAAERLSDGYAAGTGDPERLQHVTPRLTPVQSPAREFRDCAEGLEDARR